MNIATTWSVSNDTHEAVRTAYQQLKDELGAAPDLLIVYSSVKHEGSALISAFRELAPGVQLHGGTSSLGVMTADGFHSSDGVGLGILGIRDQAGNYGVGMVEIAGDGRNAGARAIQLAIENAGRIGETPALVWLNGAPGYEEDVLSGIQDVIGEKVPIAGGSTADNTVEGNWFQFTDREMHQDAVVVTAMYPSVGTHLAFHSGYSPTEHKGIVTKSDHRTIYEIDGRPAAEVYNEWTGGVVNDYLSGGNVLGVSSLNPLGRVVGTVGNLPYYRLSHPETITENKGMTLFTGIMDGQEIVAMEGSVDSLVTRAGRVSQAAIDAGKLTPEKVSGALVVYCAGCMLTVQEKMPQVAGEVREALGGSPFLGTFTFGEQGCFIRGENRHGNLMISVVVFEKGE